ncbi:MAG: sugar transferase [Clostridium sp.]
MKLPAWDKLPEKMKNEKVRPYYDVLQKKGKSLFFKRMFDIAVSFLLLIILFPICLIVAVWIKIDSPGSILFQQVRVTQFGREFRIYKFRTMVENAEMLGSQVTTSQDMRVTKAGRFLRKYRLDEFPQLLNIFIGDMSFVGTRPEVPRYVKQYTDEMYATLLLPAGVTSQASIMYKDEEQLLASVANPNDTYVQMILPKKMKFNLDDLKKFSMFNEFKTMIQTVKAVLA